MISNRLISLVMVSPHVLGVIHGYSIYKDWENKPRGLTSDNSWLKLTLCFALADGDGIESASKCFKLTNETYQKDIEMGVP